MSKGFDAIQIADNVYWVGVLDRELDDFHGYATPRGSTYNAYLIMDDRITLIDTVKKGFLREMLLRISSVIDPKKIDLIVSNHSEMDHTGSLVEAVDYINPSQVVASPMGVKAIAAQFNGFKVDPVKTGDEISIGKLTLRFVESKMLHWPDSMVTYIPQLNLLFSQDIFGLHFASTSIFADESDEAVIKYEAAKYYANIIMPYSAIALRFLDNWGKYGIDPQIIASDHGPIFRGKEWVNKVLSWYRAWATQAPSKKAVIVYDTMWESTSKLAKAIAEGLREGGCAPVEILPLSSAHRSDVATEVLDAGVFLVGSPTINNQMFPTVADMLSYIKGLRPKNKIGAAFGSYGWSGEGVKLVAAALQDMKVDVIDTLRVLYVPTDEDLAAAKEFGKKIAREALSRISN